MPFGGSYLDAIACLGKREAKSLLTLDARKPWLQSLGIDTDGDVLSRSLAAIRARLNDFISTPSNVSDALLDSPYAPSPGKILDPCAGSGAILQRLIQRGWNPKDLFACEVRLEEEEALKSLGLGDICMADWFHEGSAPWPKPGQDVFVDCPECGGTRKEYPRCLACGAGEYNTGEQGVSQWRGWPASQIVTNVPFSQIPEFPLACLNDRLPGRMKYVALLMPVEELSGVKRCKQFLSKYPPTAMVHISWRPFPNVRGVSWCIWERGKEPLRMAWA